MDIIGVYIFGGFIWVRLTTNNRGINMGEYLLVRCLKDLPNEQGFEFVGVTFSGEEVDCFVHKNFAGKYVILSLYTRQEMFGKLKGWKVLPKPINQPTNQQLLAALNDVYLAHSIGDYEVARTNAVLQELLDLRIYWSLEDLWLQLKIYRYFDWFKYEY